MKFKNLFGKFSVLFLSVLIITFNSCNKYEGKIKEFENPYKHLGVLHNQELSELLKGVDLKGLNKNEFFKKSIPLLEKKGYLKEGKDDGEELIYTIVDCLNSDYNLFIDSLYSKSLISITVKDKLHQFVNTTPSSTTSESQLLKIKDFELGIVNDKNLSPGDKEALLVYTVVTHESTLFWSDYMQNNGVKLPKWMVPMADAAALAIGMTGGQLVALGADILVSGSAYLGTSN